MVPSRGQLGARLKLEIEIHLMGIVAHGEHCQSRWLVVGEKESSAPGLVWRERIFTFPPASSPFPVAPSEIGLLHPRVVEGRVSWNS